MNEQLPSETGFLPIVCSIWRSPLMRVTKEGILIRCKSCRGMWHLITRSQLERAWSDVESDAGGIMIAEKQIPPAS